jgi:hypothetical protein
MTNERYESAFLEFVAIKTPSQLPMLLESGTPE